MIQLLYNLFRQNGIPDEISAKIIYEYNTFKHPCAIIIDKYLDDLDDLDDLELVECFLCGNIWDGNAQCNCLY